VNYVTVYVRLLTAPQHRHAQVDLGLPTSHWIKSFYDAHVALELHHSDLALELYSDLDKQYPGSTYIQAQVSARSQSHMHALSS
jgi:hypothetical protein